MIITLQFDGHINSANLLNDVATVPDRVFTTAKIDRGRLFVLGGTFDEPITQPPDEVVALDLHGRVPHS